jgi:MFS family permease
MIGWGTNQFTPMLLLYRARLGLSAPVVEAMFALYAVGLVPGLLVGGSLSDRIGRRRVMLFALVISMIGSAVLITGAHGTGLLCAGRLVVGLGSGSAFSAGAAWPATPASRPQTCCRCCNPRPPRRCCSCAWPRWQS